MKTIILALFYLSIGCISASYNSFQNNSFLVSEASLDANKIIICYNDLSTNIIDVGEDNTKVRSLFNSKQRDSKKQPKVAN